MTDHGSTPAPDSARTAGAPPSGPAEGYGLDLPPGVALPRGPRATGADANAIAAALLGALSVLSLGCCAYVSPFAALGALATGIVALTRPGGGSPQRGGRGLAVTGVVLGGLSLLAEAALIAWWASRR